MVRSEFADNCFLSFLRTALAAAYSIFAADLFTTASHFGISRLMKAENSAGVPGDASKPSAK